MSVDFEYSSTLSTWIASDSHVEANGKVDGENSWPRLISDMRKH
jgi:hypothetical protein